MNISEASVIDSTHLELDKPINLPKGTKVRVVIDPDDSSLSNEADLWSNLSSSSLAKAYGINDPEYSLKMIKEPNMDYES